MPAHSPVLIGKSITGVVNGQIASIPEGLSNPLKQGVMIDEIRFAMVTRRVAGGTWFGSVPDALRVALRVGQQELTKGLMPAALLCRPRDWAAETPSVLNNFVWRLPKPLYLPQNGRIDVQVQQHEDFRTETALLLDVDVAAVGRPTLDVPQSVDVPYASFFQGSLVTTGTTTEQSTANDLRNPFREALRVMRFSITNWARSATATDPTTTRPILSNGDYIDTPGLNGANKIQLYDQDGDFGVRDATPAGAFAALSDRSWRVDARLNPNAYFLADLSTTLSAGFTSTRLAVGMIGYRMIPLAKLGVAR